MTKQLGRQLSPDGRKAVLGEDVMASLSQDGVDPPEESPAQDARQFLGGPFLTAISQDRVLPLAFCDHEHQLDADVDDGRQKIRKSN